MARSLTLQFDDEVSNLIGSFELFKTADGATHFMVTLEATRPAEGDSHTLGASNDLDSGGLQQRSYDRLAIDAGRGFRTLTEVIPSTPEKPPTIPSRNLMECP